MPGVALYVVGTAGSGKSTFVGAFNEWAQTVDFQIMTVNLDPGAEDLPYNPDIDIRDSIRLIDIMKEHQLGPNGAQIVAADMLALEADKLREALETNDAGMAIIDTPGQIELFAFRQASEHIVATVCPNSALLYLFDPVLSRSAPGFVMQLMLAAAVQFRFRTPFIPALSKADLLSDEEVDRIRKWSESGESLFDALDLSATGPPGGTEPAVPELSSSSPMMSAQMARELLKVYESLGVTKNLVPISSEVPFGFEDLYSAIRLIFYAGEDPEMPGSAKNV